MKSVLIIALGIASTAVLVSAHAQTYQWKDSNGRTVISDTPPPGAAKTPRALGAPQPSAAGNEKAPEKVADTPKTTAEKDLDFKKRQQDAKEKAEKDAREQKLAADKQENCERARRNLAALESQQPMTTYDDKGERKLMDDGQREQEKEHARRYIAEACK